MQFTADQVWGLAVRADRINGGYCKEEVFEDREGALVKVKETNKSMVKGWLRDNTQPTADEIEQGQKVRSHFSTYTFLALSGKLNDFQLQAMKIAAMDEFTGRNMLEFSVISCLPEVARRDAARTEFMRDLYASEQLVGTTGEAVNGYITVSQCRFNANFNKYRIVARMGESFVDFWFTRALTVGSNLRIKGKIKNVRGDKTTQLNYVKIIG